MAIAGFFASLELATTSSADFAAGRFNTFGPFDFSFGTGFGLALGTLGSGLAWTPLLLMLSAWPESHLLVRRVLLA